MKIAVLSSEHREHPPTTTLSIELKLGATCDEMEKEIHDTKSIKRTISYVLEDLAAGEDFQSQIGKLKLKSLQECLNKTLPLLTELEKLLDQTKKG